MLTLPPLQQQPTEGFTAELASMVGVEVLRLPRTHGDRPDVHMDNRHKLPLYLVLLFLNILFHSLAVAALRRDACNMVNETSIFWFLNPDRQPTGAYENRYGAA